MEGINVAELTSIDELVQLMVRKGLIPEPVTQTLYGIMTGDRTDPQRLRSAFLLFGMIGRADRGAVERRVEGLVRAGLSPEVRDPLVAQSCCQALQAIAYGDADAKQVVRLPNDNVLFARLVDFCVQNCVTPEWYFPFGGPN